MHVLFTDTSLHYSINVCFISTIPSYCSRLYNSFSNSRQPRAIATNWTSSWSIGCCTCSHHSCCSHCYCDCVCTEKVNLSHNVLHGNYHFQLQTLSITITFLFLLHTGKRMLSLFTMSRKDQKLTVVSVVPTVWNHTMQHVALQSL